MNNPAYPPVIRPDPRLAARMMRAYNDELNQVITYTYQHLLTEGLDNEASQLFLRLSREDMAHFHTLGRLIRALGGDPGVTMRMRTPRIDLSGDASCRALPVVRRMLRQDLSAEAATVTELESLAATARDTAVISELREIIREEREQYEALERLLGTF
jgi:rubrerythrin